MSLSIAVMQLAYGFVNVTLTLPQLGDHLTILVMHSLKDTSKNRIYKPAHSLSRPIQVA
jgi:hypothetical protein